MKINQMIQRMKQLSGRIGSGVYASVQDQSNPHHISFLRQLQKEVKRSEDDLDTPFKDLEVVVFDLETTGFYPDKGDQIISIGAVKVYGKEIQSDQFYSLVNAEVEVSTEIEELTGINQQDVEKAPGITEVLVNFYDFIKQNTLVAHHARHEKSFMGHVSWNLLRAPFQHRIVDTSFLIKIAEPNGKKIISLDECCHHVGIEIKNRHHALGDAMMTAQLWSQYLIKIEKLGYKNLRDVYEGLAKMA